MMLLHSSAYTKSRLRRLTMAVLLATLAFLVACKPAPGKNRDKDLCGQTSEDMLRSCQFDAQGDYWVALGKCENVSDPSERKACRQQARNDLNAALELCKDQFRARQDVCEDLGPGPYDPAVDPANFVAKVDNPYFPLTPGTTLIYEGKTEKGLEHDEVEVTHKTRVILGVTCTEVHDVVTADGELIEDTLDWYAQDKDGNVWYFGENARQIQGGLVIGVEGSWEAGVDDAKQGIIMKAHPQVGDVYRQEFSLGVAEDVAEVLSLKESVTVPFGSFAGCLETEDFAPIEPDAAEHKFYAKDVGFVLAVDVATGNRLELIAVKKE